MKVHIISTFLDYFLITMTSKSVEKLFTIKELAVEHLKAGRYGQASVYFKDLL